MKKPIAAATSITLLQLSMLVGLFLLHSVAPALLGGAVRPGCFRSRQQQHQQRRRRHPVRPDRFSTTMTNFAWASTITTASSNSRKGRGNPPNNDQVQEPSTTGSTASTSFSSTSTTVVVVPAVTAEAAVDTVHPKRDGTRAMSKPNTLFLSVSNNNQPSSRMSAEEIHDETTLPLLLRLEPTFHRPKRIPR